MFIDKIPRIREKVSRLIPPQVIENISNHTRSRVVENTESANKGGYQCGADVTYYLKGEKETTPPSPSLENWLERIHIQSPLITRILEVIQVLETGRGSVRAKIKEVAKMLAEHGFVDEIKSRGLMQMRSNFVVSKLIKDLMLKPVDQLHESERSLVDTLAQYRDLQTYVSLGPEFDSELEQLTTRATFIESDYSELFAENLSTNLNELIQFDYLKQRKRNQSNWSLLEVAKMLSQKSFLHRRIFRLVNTGLFADECLVNLKTSKERLCKLLSVLISMCERNISYAEIKEYLDLKIVIFNYIKPRDRAVDEIKTILDKQDGVSVWVAKEIMSQNLETLENMAVANGETFDVNTNWIAMRMFISSYNRGVSKITLSMMQNWVYEFSKLTIDPESNDNFLKQRDIDSSFKKPAQRERLINKMQSSFLTTCMELSLTEDLLAGFTIVDFHQACQLLMDSNLRARFITHPVVKALKEIYSAKYQKDLSVIFTEEQMQAYYFSYGAKIMRSQEDFRNL